MVRIMFRYTSVDEQLPTVKTIPLPPANSIGYNFDHDGWEERLGTAIMKFLRKLPWPFLQFALFSFESMKHPIPIHSIVIIIPHRD
jgi:hypothetical protein